MARLTVKDVNEKLFWELANSGIVGDWSLHIVEDYLYMIAEKLKKDTEINFRVEDYNIVNEQLGISIPSTDCTSYDKILQIIEKSLGETAKENKFGVDVNRMKNEWGYTFSNTSMSPYFETNARKWKSYDEFEQAKVFEAFYFGVGQFRKEFADTVKCSGVGRRIGAGRAPDGTLVDDDGFVHMFKTFDGTVFPRRQIEDALMCIQRPHKDTVDE